MVIIDHYEYLCEEEKRLKEDRERTRYWKRWGPYVAERQWATGLFSAFPWLVVAPRPPSTVQYYQLVYYCTIAGFFFLLSEFNGFVLMTFLFSVDR